jgi:hypothetical protein
MGGMVARTEADGYRWCLFLCQDHISKTQMVLQLTRSAKSYINFDFPIPLDWAIAIVRP